ncbi:MAG: VWA domain-containing protein [Acidobacteriia bacterium]|nr:VWA domain-containing protein [Terriglobia bacterium]
MMQRRTFLPLLATAGLAQEEADKKVFSTTVNVVVAPVTVTDKDGRHVSGLEGKDFTLFDNEKSQDIRVDVSFIPISMVVAVQSNDSVEVILPAIKKIGPLIEGLVIGTQGEAAILAFDHRLRVMQQFTGDGRLLTAALAKINAGSSTSAMIDSVFEATRMLRRRPQSHRKILLLITESRDGGSEGRLREALLEAQIHNVIVYTININRALGMFTKKMPVPRPDPFPVGARPVPGGAPMTPGTTEALTGYRGQSANFVPVFIEIFKQAKGLFVDNPAEVMTQYTGGREFSFINQKSLEEAMSKLGEELHSQYLLSYTPNNLQQGGWHDIRVDVAKNALEVRTRRGYWMASVPR